MFKAEGKFVVIFKKPGPPPKPGYLDGTNYLSMATRRGCYGGLRVRRGHYTGTMILREATVFANVAAARRALRSTIAMRFKARDYTFTIHIVAERRDKFGRLISREVRSEVWPTIENPIEALGVIA